jgi:hypothetical protein
MTKDRVSAICRGLDEQVELFRQPPVAGAYPYQRPERLDERFAGTVVAGLRGEHQAAFARRRAALSAAVAPSRRRPTAATMVPHIELPSGEPVPVLGQGSRGLGEVRRPAVEQLVAALERLRERRLISHWGVAGLWVSHPGVVARVRPTLPRSPGGRL